MTKVNRKQALKKMTMSAGLLALSEMGGAVPSVADEIDTKDKALNSLQEKTIDWKTSALIVVDMQNDFVRKGAPLEVPTALGTAAAQKALILAFRNRKLPIVYTKFISHPHYYCYGNGLHNVSRRRSVAGKVTSDTTRTLARRATALRS